MQRSSSPSGSGPLDVTHVERPGALPRLGRWAAESTFFLLPLLAFITIVIVVPTCIAIYRSFYQWNPGYESPFVGFDNYVDLWNSPVFREVLKNEAVYLLGLPLWCVLPLVVSLMLYDRVPGAAVFRTIFFFPAILSPAIVGILFRAILAPDGLLNSTLRAAGLDGLTRNWIDDPALVKPVIILVIAWAGLGFGVLFFSAALASIPPELFEAAAIDGASSYQRMRYVMLPGIRAVFEFYVVFQVIGVFLFFFGWIYVLTQGGPGFSSTTMDYDVYTNGFTYGYFGLAAAEGVYLLAIVAVIILLGLRIAGRGERQERREARRAAKAAR